MGIRRTAYPSGFIIPDNCAEPADGCDFPREFQLQGSWWRFICQVGGGWGGVGWWVGGGGGGGGLWGGGGGGGGEYPFPPILKVNLRRKVAINKTIWKMPELMGR